MILVAGLRYVPSLLCYGTALASREFLTVVCLIIEPFSSRPPRHAGDTREGIDGGLPYCSVCVSFNYFSSRFS